MAVSPEGAAQFCTMMLAPNVLRDRSRCAIGKRTKSNGSRSNSNVFFSTHQRARPSVLLSVAMIFCLLITGAWVCTARAITPPAPGLAPTPHGTAGTYLALGDSIAFSYTPLRNPDNAANFAGYPDGVARAHGLALSNAACPGATSSYFVALTGADWNCHSYRSQYPLHVTYMTAQLSYAITYLKTHPTTRLVTQAIGYNDVFRLEAQCQWDPACIAAGLPGTLATLAYNLQMIYAGLRTVAGYHGRLVMLTYYALDAQNAP